MHSPAQARTGPLGPGGLAGPNPIDLAEPRGTSLDSIPRGNGIAPGTGVHMAFSRRTFIENLAVIGGMSLAVAGMEALGFGFASAQTSPPTLTGKGKGTRVVVLGAGLAGLTAAYELTKAGYDVQVIEARSFA